MEINYLHFDTLTSTNSWSKENYKDFDLTKITLVTADQQTGGYGRYKRAWVSPGKKNIYATFTFFLNKDQKDLKNLTQILALAVVKTLREFGVFPQIKWPNDIQINQKKVAGILCEMIAEKQDFIIFAGIGININMPGEAFHQISQPATSLLVEEGKELNLLEILNILQRSVSSALELFIQEGFKPFLEDFRHCLVHNKGDIIKHNQQEGFFLGIADDGGLQMKLKDGTVEKRFSGEVQN